MRNFELQERFSDRYEKLNDSGKQYISAILQSLEFAQLEAKLLKKESKKNDNAPNK